ncbi:hypothetical protein [Desulfovibrio inopinatus]|uniref:hypothetical protein n=1 Tax=Desulfovibrio inopinatus TaxID=102109 RepID=UPI00041F44C7|nr:hypothetical protein [Desulfovibrio inopinatus]
MKEKIVSKDRVRLIVNTQDGPGGMDDVFVSVNGRAYLIKRDHEVEVPAEVYQVLESSEGPAMDGRSGGNVVKRFSINVIG